MLRRQQLILNHQLRIRIQYMISAMPLSNEYLRCVALTPEKLNRLENDRKGIR